MMLKERYEVGALLRKEFRRTLERADFLYGCTWREIKYFFESEFLVEGSREAIRYIGKVMAERG